MTAKTTATRADMTPQTIAANHATHVSDTAHALRHTARMILAGEWIGSHVTPTEAAEHIARQALALLAAIGEGER